MLNSSGFRRAKGSSRAWLRSPFGGLVWQIGPGFREVTRFDPGAKKPGVAVGLILVPGNLVSSLRSSEHPVLFRRQQHIFRPDMRE